MKVQIVKVGRKYRIKKTFSFLGITWFSYFMSYDNGDSSDISFGYYEFKNKLEAKYFLKHLL